MMIATVRSLYRFRRSEEGATAVEAALVILVFVLLIFGLVQFAEIFWTWNTMILALGEGGRYAMIYNPTNFPNGPPASSCSVASPTLAKCAVAQANAALTTYPSLSVTVSCTAGCTGTPATMTLQGTFTFDFVAAQLLPYGPITMTQQLTVPLS
jgi:Flp pilus assembly protein TadG